MQVRGDKLMVSPGLNIYYSKHQYTSNNGLTKAHSVKMEQQCSTRNFAVPGSKILADQDLSFVDWKKSLKIISSRNWMKISYCICSSLIQRELQRNHRTNIQSDFCDLRDQMTDSLLWLKINICATLLKERKVAVNCSSISLSFCLHTDQLS